VVPGPRGHLDALLARCDSELERRWLRLVARRGLRLPDDAQPAVPEAESRPDFLYRSAMVAVYVDGPAHDFPERRERDAVVTDRMERLGYTVLRFGHEDDWEALLDANAMRLGGMPPQRDADVEHGAPPLDLFPASWRDLVARLREEHGLDVRPGEDVTDEGVVVGASAAVVRLGGVRVVLVDAADAAAPAVAAAVEDRGGLAMVVDPAAPEAEAAILKSLGAG
jgi:hypothetical protein